MDSSPLESKSPWKLLYNYMIKLDEVYEPWDYLDKDAFSTGNVYKSKLDKWYMTLKFILGYLLNKIFLFIKQV